MVWVEVKVNNKYHPHTQENGNLSSTFTVRLILLNSWKSWNKWFDFGMCNVYTVYILLDLLYIVVYCMYIICITYTWYSCICLYNIYICMFAAGKFNMLSVIIITYPVSRLTCPHSRGSDTHSIYTYRNRFTNIGFLAAHIWE